MSRTERRGRDVVGDPMLEVRDLSVDLSVNDIEAYLQARELADAVKAPGVMEYWKSAPYLLSFMERYRLPQRLEEAAKVRLRAGLWLDLSGRAPGYRSAGDASLGRRALDAGNGRMRAFLRDINDSRLQGLLWLPPVMPSYELGKDFRNTADATKRLVFSSWAMVPRAVAIMGSYDAERRYITDDNQEARYGLSLRPDAYPLFSLISPSHSLAEYGDPLRYPTGSADRMLEAIEDRLRPFASWRSLAALQRKEGLSPCGTRSHPCCSTSRPRTPRLDGRPVAGATCGRSGTDSGVYNMALARRSHQGGPGTREDVRPWTPPGRSRTGSCADGAGFPFECIAQGPLAGGFNADQRRRPQERGHAGRLGISLPVSGTCRRGPAEQDVQPGNTGMQ